MDHQCSCNYPMTPKTREDFYDKSRSTEWNVSVPMFIKHLIVCVDMLREDYAKHITTRQLMFTVEKKVHMLREQRKTMSDDCKFHLRVFFEYFAKLIAEYEFALPERVYVSDCILCYRKPQSVFLECGHQCMCTECSLNYCKHNGWGAVKCPMCNGASQLCLNKHMMQNLRWYAKRSAIASVVPACECAPEPPAGALRLAPRHD